ncbi:unnamed protein product [Leptosia nina]|uniref:Kazal-like domain-containing protein n=1 Tax=Leptosia nina TaxID=320188 RepID=A0AAV1JGC2_9NEOP
MGVWQQSIRSRVLAELTGGKMILRQGNETVEEAKKNCMCSKIYDPVCASNNKSYYNVCQMECENEANTVFVVHHGNCIPY